MQPNAKKAGEEASTSADVKKEYRSMLFIDASNIFLPAKKRGVRIDWIKLRDVLSKGKFVIQTHYFTAIDVNNAGQVRLMKKLRESGFIVHTNPLLFREKHFFCKNCGEIQNITCPNCGSNITLPPHQSKEIDIKIGMNAILGASSYDELILVSGDRDFLSVVQHLRIHLSKRVVIVSYSETCSYVYQQEADKIIPFEEIEREVSYIK